jgi:clan AA aspartic protease (TIGR02281 family)
MFRFGCGMLAILAMALIVVPARSANAPVDVLTARGLVKKGLFYVLPGEQEVQGSMKDLRAAKHKVDEDAKSRQEIENRLRQVKGIMANLEHEMQADLGDLATEKSASRHNQLVAKVNQYQSQLKEGEDVKNDLNTKLRALGDTARNDYIGIILGVGEKVDKATAGYAELAKDEEVKAALEELNKKPGPKWKLGPSPEFLANSKEIAKLRGDVASAVIPLRQEGGINLVDVVLNGKLTRQFIVDSGASVVCLPFDLAEELGMTPTDKDPKVRFRQADGKVIEAFQKTLKSVRVGGFAVEQVECAVYPKDLPNTPMLLGGSFLGNFIYRLDPEKGELHLAAVGKSDKRIITGLDKPEPKPVADKLPTPPAPIAQTTPRPQPTGPAAESGQGVPRKEPIASSENPRPTVIPGKPAPRKNPASKLSAEKVATYLEGEYSRKLESKDWRTRGLAVVSLARLPQQSVTEKLLKLTDTDPHEVVKLLAWQGILARASALTGQEHVRWMNSTLTLAEKGAFRGRLRTPLIQVLATAPMTGRSKKIFEKLANDANAWEPYDIPVCRALGRCLAAWKSGQLAEGLIGALSNENFAVRAEFILQEAGCDAPTARSLLSPDVFNPQAKGREHPSSTQLWRTAQEGYAAWLKKNRAQWREATTIPNEPWKELRPFYVEPPVAMEAIDPDDKVWRADFELGGTNIKAFEVAFCVDATESMGEVLNWLSRDLARMTTALSAGSLEPRIGLTFYRDHDDTFVTRTLPLSGNVKPLLEAIESTGAEGGGDIPEAVMEGLRDTVAKSNWSHRQDGGKAIVLIGDAPPHPQDVSECVRIAEQARKQGFKFYAVKVTTEFGANDLSSFDDIAQAAGGLAVACNFPAMSTTRFIDERKREIPLASIPRPEAQLVVAPMPPADDPTDKVLVSILADAINPQWKDRLGPLVKTLLAWSEPTSKPETRKGFPANTPSLSKGELKRQG